VATNFVVANTNFDWAGVKIRVGDVFVDTHTFYVRFPTRFDRQQTYVTGSPGTVLVGGTLGATVAGKLPVTDSAGTVLGYVALFNEITGT
jgi:hypothetical protein